jgi:hypothetical protein
MMSEPIDNEVALREEIADLHLRMAALRQSLGALENEIRKREGEYITIRSARWVGSDE